MYMCMQKLQRGMNKSKQMQFELDSILTDNFPLTAKNLQNAFFTLCSWDLRIGGYITPISSFCNRVTLTLTSPDNNEDCSFSF